MVYSSRDESEEEMINMLWRYKECGGHTHVAVFADVNMECTSRGKCGDLVFRNEEWAQLKPQLVELGHELQEITSP